MPLNIVKVLILKQNLSWTERRYFDIGLLISRLTSYLRLIENQPHYWEGVA